MFNPQFNRYGELTHLLTTEGLPRRILEQILDAAQAFVPEAGATPQANTSLQGRRVFTLFCESSRQALPSPTRDSFTIAAQGLSAEVLDVNDAGACQGGTLLETLRRLPATPDDLLVLRHGASGAAYTVLTHNVCPAHIINAGDGRHAHPTQALIDMLGIRRIKHDFTTLTVAIVGDILHSGLARSTIHALTTLGAPELRVVAPMALLPEGLPQLGVRACASVEEGLADADVIILLHPGRALEGTSQWPSKLAYYRDYALTPERLAHAKPDALVLHAGPMDVGVDPAGHALALRLQQPVLALALRQAVMCQLAGAQT